MILSVGYRVKSNKGIIFRRWANKVLKEYTLKGYAVNTRRLEYIVSKCKIGEIRKWRILDFQCYGIG